LEGIAGVPWTAGARRQVIHNLTIGVLSARSWTWVLALVTNAGFVGGAVSVQDTFRPAALVRIANIFWEANTGSSSTLFTANRISPARCWITRVDVLFGWRRSSGVAHSKGISGEALETKASWSMVNHSAFSVCSASAGTRILALLVDASKVPWTIAVTDTLWSAIRGCSAESWKTGT